MSTRTQLRKLEAASLGASAFLAVATYLTVSTGQAVEANPFVVAVIGEVPWFGLAGVKILSVVGGFAVFRRVERMDLENSNPSQIAISGAVSTTVILFANVINDAIILSKTVPETFLLFDVAALSVGGVCLILARFGLTGLHHRVYLKRLFSKRRKVVSASMTLLLAVSMISGAIVLDASANNSTTERDGTLSVAGFPDEGNWSGNISPLSESVDKHGMVSVDGVPYRVGGQLGGGDSNTIKKYNKSSDTWVSLTNIPKSVQAAAVVSHGGNIYTFSGQVGGSESSTAYKYNVENDSWTTISNYPISVINLNGAVVNDSIYLSGGYDIGGGSAVNNVYKYDIENDTYSQVSGLPSSTQGHASASVNGNVFAISGINAGGTVYKYAPETDTWTTVNSYPAGGNEPAAVGVQGKIYITGGEDNPSTYKYSPANDTYSQLSDMSQSRFRHAATEANGYMYVSGDDGASNSVEVYNIAGVTGGQSDATVSGVVRDQNGDPVSNATVVSVGFDAKNFTGSKREIQQEIASIREQLNDVTPANWTQQVEGDFSITGSDGVLQSNAEGVAVHTLGAWQDADLSTPGTNFEPGEPLVFSIWADECGGFTGALYQDNYDSDLSGVCIQDSTDVVVERISMEGSIQDRSVQSTATFQQAIGTNEHEVAIRTSGLSTGFYRVYP
ncbi:Kelch repeat-containing protein [Halorubellus salinus]|uniref:Kelch repeat-containing protein n=1 Tax=Halorubellus salinus TaxID=755309 RepID=UPI001D074A79|nr:kelch repeat-containing protein [Halorubellus salinus]